MEAQSSQLIQGFRDTTSLPRLLLDGRKLGDGGIGVYIDNTVRGLLERADTRITVISSRERAESARWRSEVSWIYDSSKGYSLSEYFLLPRRIDFSGFDLYHSPHYTLPFGVSIPAVVTIHDLIHITHPESFYYPLIAKRLISSAVTRAARVIAVSADTRDAVIRLTGVNPRKVVHIPNAIPSFVSHDRREERLSDAKMPLCVPANERYFVAVISNDKPHKGVSDLLRAWPLFIERYKRASATNMEPRLILAGYGSESLKSSKYLSRLLMRAGSVSVLGSVESDALRDLYRGADALIVPSLAEGFCLPALEARSVGTRVICRPVPAIEELVTDDDVVARDLSVEALVDAIYTGAIADRHAREIAYEDLERFSLRAVAERTRSVYGSVLARDSRIFLGDRRVA